jgi:hypothetical protein
MYKDADGRLYTREELDAAPGDLLTEYIPPYDYATSETAYGRTVHFSFAIKVF